MRHTPVLLTQVMESLQLGPSSSVIDATIGDAGHAQEVLKRTAPDGRLLGLDADAESLLRAQRFLYEYGHRVTLVRSNFSRLLEVAQINDFVPADAVLLDLGWSTPQFKERGRGFSFDSDEPLDMRYAPHETVQREIYGLNNPTAAQLLNTLHEDDLAELFKTFGEEKQAGKISEMIVRTRRVNQYERTGQLVETVNEVYRAVLKSKARQPYVGGIHPATRVFQALRIAVNDELNVLKEVLPQVVEALRPETALKTGGRAVIISFHSLEDRIIKHFFKSQDTKSIRIITKKPITARPEEIKQNPSARSAKLRVVERLA